MTASREFPATARLDVQTGVEGLLKGPLEPRRILGVHAVFSHQTPTFADLIVEGPNAFLIAPLQYDEIDTGEAMPVRCLRTALWLCGGDGDLPVALFISRVQNYGRVAGLHIEIAVPPGEAGLKLSQQLFLDLERKVTEAGSYRGKVLSLEMSDNYRGGISGVKVHRLKMVERDQVILSEKTLALLDRNVIAFASQRQRLREMRMGVKKGLLFYGPPGTGKTHTIHYLANSLKDHTTLLITAEQVGALDQYMQLARFLQPSIVVIEDVDLIARARTDMRSPCEESLLNKLLNEMDGLREDAMILFILTTNHPEHLEAALTSRPGRVDQAIEFSLPDDDGRRKLLRLYSRDMEVSDDLMGHLVGKTAGGSGAFIKELMRRSAQYLLESGGQTLEVRHVDDALGEMLFMGGSLNAKILGFANGEKS